MHHMYASVQEGDMFSKQSDGGKTIDQVLEEDHGDEFICIQHIRL